MQYGYIRVSSTGQNVARQVDALHAAGVASAAAKDEPPTTVVIATLADVGYHRELSAWLKACE